MSDVSIPPSNVGDISRVSPMNPRFWDTFGHYMPYSPNLILSLFRNMQWPSQQRPPQLTTQHIGQPTPSQPSPQPPRGTRTQTLQPMSSVQVDVSNTNKILLKSEDDT